MTAYDAILDRLAEHGCKVSRNGVGTMAQCPAHEDRNPSLSIRQTESRARVHCFAGCDDTAVLDALGLATRDLYNEPRRVDYNYGNGYVVHRDPATKRFWQSGIPDGPRPLYRASRIRAAVAAGQTVYLVEGEEDVHAVEAAGGIATTAPQGAVSFGTADLEPLHDAEVVAIADQDDAGQRWAETVRANLEPIAKSISFAKPRIGKDFSDHYAAGHGLDGLVPGTYPGNAEQAEAECSPFPTPYVRNAEHLFLDVSAMLDGNMPEPPRPVACTRSDGNALFYAGQVNLIFGDPESGKTLLAQAAIVEALDRGEKVLVLDLDHNGPEATITRLLALGAPVEALRDRDQFRYVEPDDQTHLRSIMSAAIVWAPAVAVVDSIGELLPIMALSSNSPDDFTIAHTRVLKPLAKAGACVLAIDHLAKNTESRAAGPTGTAAKRRAVGGVSLRVVIKDQFTPGEGGSAALTVHKDRHGGLRKHCPPPKAGEAYAGTFVLDEAQGHISWRVVAPRPDDTAPNQRLDLDVQQIAALEPAPTSVRDVKDRLNWGTDRASKALEEWRSSFLTHRGRNEEHAPDADPGVAA